LTASAGVRPGVHLRTWHWLDRPVSDAEARRWLRGAPVDASLFNPVQPIYTCAPVFKPASADPVPRRSGWHLRPGGATLAVPDLTPPAPPPRSPRPPTPIAGDRVQRYVEGILSNVISASDGQRHAALKSAAPVVFSLAEAGLLPEAEAWVVLEHTAAACGWPERRAANLLAWARSHAASQPRIPSGLS
jgi:hypothetical protein